MPAFIDLTGKVFGRLTVLGRNPQNHKRGARWDCQCVCGKLLTVIGESLRSGNTCSCGCWRKEVTRNRRTLHGQYSQGRRTTEIVRWKRAVSRCHNPKDRDFHRWGGRGISFCDAWRHDFIAYRDYIRSIGFTGEPGQTLDRINNDGNYQPGNLRVTDAAGQSRNRRDNRLITAFGETHCVAEWAERTGISYAVLLTRLGRLHWTPERALTEPVRKLKLKTAAIGA
jgi:hypothetical protein